MKILGLYNNICALELFEWIERQGHELIKTSDVLDPSWCRAEKFDLAISYTYRFIISQDIIDIFDGNIVNIHNSYLPWNRGADPNLWSIVDGTPRGVTLHYIDSGLDKGEIISQVLADDIDEKSTLLSVAKGSDYCLTEGEKSSLAFRRSILASKDIKQGELFTDDNIRVIRPSYGIAPKYYDDIISKKSKRNIKRGEPVTFDDF